MTGALPSPESSTAAVVLVAHGSVDRVDDIAQFLSNIRRGRPTPPAIVDEVTHRWQQIGGSPLNRIARAQAEALSQRLGLRCLVANRMWYPYPQEVVSELVAAGVSTVVSVPLAPYSVSLYHQELEPHCVRAGVRCMQCLPWNTEPALIDAFVEVIREALERLPSEAHATTAVLLTAHSLPARVIAAGDRYEIDVRATAAAVEKALGRPCELAFQSQGMDGGEWLGPDLPTTFARMAQSGIRQVVACAIGFLADHTEVLYDLDVEAAATCRRHGMELVRAASLNTRPRFIDALESVARATLSSAAGAGLEGAIQTQPERSHGSV